METEREARTVRVEPLVVPLPAGIDGRMECGPVQFGDDWPGVWLRGDYAMAHAMYVEQAADRIEAADPLGWMDAMYLRGLAKQLRSCDARHNAQVQPGRSPRLQCPVGRSEGGEQK